jgi:hypothetical protein
MRVDWKLPHRLCQIKSMLHRVPQETEKLKTGTANLKEINEPAQTDEWSLTSQNLPWRDHIELSQLASTRNELLQSCQTLA